MKKISLIFVFISFSLTQFAQDPIFSSGDKVVNFGLGLGTTLYTGSYYKMSVPPLSVSYEVGIKDDVIEKGSVGVGGYLGYSAYKWEYSNWGWKYSNLIIGARGSFHYPLVDKIDTYTGLLLGYNISTSKEFGDAIPGYDYSTSSGGIMVAWYVGGRYYFKDKYAAMAELGYGITYLNLGVAIKL